MQALLHASTQDVVQDAITPACKMQALLHASTQALKMSCKMQALKPSTHMLRREAWF